jgi:hypothetical protein
MRDLRLAGGLPLLDVEPCPARSNSPRAWAISVTTMIQSKPYSAASKALVWIASVGKEAQLTPEAHLYFYDRYSRLAECHRRRGRWKQAERFKAKAEMYYLPGGDIGGPPYAAAMAMPRPRRLIRTDAVSRNRVDGPDDAA